MSNMNGVSTQPRTAIAVSPQVLAADYVSPAAREAIQKAAADAHELAQQVDAATVESANGAARLTEILSIAAATRKAVDDARLSITAPLKARAKQIEDAVRPLTTAIEDLINAGKRKVLAWQRAEDERVRREREERARVEAETRRKAEEAAAAGRQLPGPIAAAVATLGVLPPVAEAPRGVRTDYGTASVRKVWDYEVVDTSKLPAMFLVPNERAIRASVNAGVREIPGVRIYQRDELAVRAR